MINQTSVLKSWNSVKNKGVKPLNETSTGSDTSKRKEFLIGAELLGLIGGKKKLQPQQLRFADVLSLLKMFTAVLMPRRSAKTTTLWAFALGKCMENDDYFAVYTALTTGAKARQRFKKDVVPPLERWLTKNYPSEGSRRNPDAPFYILIGNGTEAVMFKNGSILSVVAPNSDGFRSDGYDLIILDESGEPDPELADEILSAALPTMDTKPDGMIVFAGTAGKFRETNLLWERLKDARGGKKNSAILEYAVPDNVPEAQLEGWTKTPESPEGNIKELLKKCHPGLDGLTTMDKLEANYEMLGQEQFLAEYLGIFGDTSNSKGIIDPERWELGRVSSALPTPPEKFCIAVMAHRDGTHASIVAAWRVQGRAHILVMENKKGVEWLVSKTGTLFQKYKMKIGYDNGSGPTMVEVKAMERKRPMLIKYLRPYATNDIKQAAALIMKEIDAANVTHYDQPTLNEAARIATKRRIGVNGFGFSSPRFTDDITSLEAAALALHTYDSETIAVTKLAMPSRKKKDN